MHDLTHEVPDESARQGSAVGRVLRHLRTRQKLTLQQLSRASGVSVAMLSKIENGGGDPSLASLRKLSKSLKVPMASFFVDEGLDADDARIRLNRKQTFSSEGVETTVLITPLNPSIRVLLLKAQPGAHRPPQAYPLLGPNAYEQGVIIRGAMRLTIADSQFELVAGDTISFPSRHMRSWSNPAEDELVAVWTTFDDAKHQDSDA